MSDSNRSKSVRINRYHTLCPSAVIFSVPVPENLHIIGVRTSSQTSTHLFPDNYIFGGCHTVITISPISCQCHHIRHSNTVESLWVNLNVTKLSIVCSDLFQIKFTYTLHSNGKSQRIDTKHWEAQTLPITWVSYRGVNSYNTKVIYN